MKDDTNSSLKHLPSMNTGMTASCKYVQDNWNYLQTGDTVFRADTSLLNSMLPIHHILTSNTMAAIAPGSVHDNTSSKV